MLNLARTAARHVRGGRACARAQAAAPAPRPAAATWHRRLGSATDRATDTGAAAADTDAAASDDHAAAAEASPAADTDAAASDDHAATAESPAADTDADTGTAPESEAAKAERYARLAAAANAWNDSGYVGYMENQKKKGWKS